MSHIINLYILRCLRTENISALNLEGTRDIFLNRSAVSIAALLAIGFSVRYVPRVTRSVEDRKPLPSEDDKMGRNYRALKETTKLDALYTNMLLDKDSYLFKGHIWPMRS